MKIQKLDIGSYRHLENLHFDFTYPKGHSKEGQPLEKICIIGQSATGKTSVLEYIKEAIMAFFENPEIISPNNSHSIEPQVKFKEIIGDIEFRLDKQIIKYNHNQISFKGENILNHDFWEEFINHFISPVLHYYTTETLSSNSYHIISQNPIEVIHQFSQENNKGTSQQPKRIPSNSNEHLQLIKSNKIKQYEDIKKLKVLEFNNQTNSFIWFYIFDEITEYREKLTQKGSELISKGYHTDAKKFQVDMDKWIKENPNPLIELADKCLNPILKKLNLEVDIIETSSFIPIKQINNEVSIPAYGLSTGTRQLMLNSLPIFKLDTKDSIIMIDEPERSLYPDVQIELMSYYKNLAPDAQFIVATHSPFIAAAFEPEERFILYFDNEGKVQVRNGVSPIGDDPNDILKNDFGIESLMNSFGVQAYKNYVDLKQKLEQEVEPQKKKELLKEAVLLGDKYKF